MHVLPQKSSAGWLYHIKFANKRCATSARANSNQLIFSGRKLNVFIRSDSSETAQAIGNRLSNAAFEALIRLYMLADKLQDLLTANMIMDELICFSSKTNEVPKHGSISLAYSSTASSSPLRTLLRD